VNERNRDFAPIATRKNADDMKTIECYSFPVDEDSISGRIESLRREIELIREAERNYRIQNHHFRKSKSVHEKRQLRLVQIREELEKLRLQSH
jgi:hypothetical protein